MADRQKTIEIIFGGVDRTGQAVSSVGRNLDALSSRASSVTGPMADITDSIVKLDAVLVAAGAAMLAFATKEAVTFEAALIDLQKVMDESEGSASDYSDQFSELSSRFGVSADAIISSTADFRQAGFDIGESLTLVEQSLLAVNAADLTTQQSSELLIGTLAGFKAPASEAAHLLDVLNGVSNNAGASVEQLGEGFKILSPVAKTLGLSFEETAALLTPIVEVTRSGSESANALRTAISNLIKPTKERKQLLEEELGIQLEVNGERRDTKDVLYDLIDATQGLDNNEKQRIATVIAGAEQMSRFLAVLNGAERSEEILQVALQSSGSALEEFQTKTSSAEFALKQLRAAFTTAAATAGLEYIDQTRAVTQATTNLVDSFREALQGDNAGVLFDALRSGLDGFAEQIEVIAQNLPAAFEGLDFTQFLSAFDDLGDELGELFSALFGDIDLGTVEGLEAAMQKVVDAFTALINISAGIASGLEPFFELIGGGIEKFQSLDESTKKTVGEMLGLGKAIDTVLPAVGALGGGLGAIGSGLTALAGASGFKTLITNLDSVKSIASGAGRFGLVGAALVGSAGVGYGIGTLIDQAIIDPIEDAFGGSIGGWLYDQLNAGEIAKAEAQWKGYSAEVRRAAKDTQDISDIKKILNRNLTDMTVATKEQQAGWQSYADQLVEAAKSSKDLADSQQGIAGAVGDLSRTATESSGALDDVSRTTQALAENNKTLQLGYDEATGKVNSFSGTIVKSGESVEDAAKKTEKAIEETEKFRIEMEKIASNERIANFEAKISLDIADVEAGAKRFESITQGLSDTVTSTGDVISSLFGSLGEGNFKDQWAIEKQIRLENERRTDSLNLQNELTKAEIEAAKARTRALRKGDALIKIEGSGLAPHLKAFMFEILSEIQVRVNAEGQEMLLGLGGNG